MVAVFSESLVLKENEDEIVAFYDEYNDWMKKVNGGISIALGKDNSVFYIALGKHSGVEMQTEFHIPAEVTEGKSGQCWYCFIYDRNFNYNHKFPLYIIPKN